MLESLTEKYTTPEDPQVAMDSVQEPLLSGVALDGAQSSLEDLEVYLLLEGVFRRYGVDFRDYSMPSLKRRILRAALAEHLTSISALQDRILHDRSAWLRFLRMLSVHVTMFFRDPAFFRTFRERVVPHLRKQPFFRIWHVGCSSGEEVYSMAILLQEEGLLGKGRLYGTDLNDATLAKARAGIYSLDLLQAYETNYLAAGGRTRFSDYYTAKYDSGIMRSSLRENLVFAQHNLTSDGRFAEFDVILCRNVLIYFNKTLQQRVHILMHESLSKGGYLGVGHRENLKHTALEPFYHVVEPVGEAVELYRKINDAPILP